MTSERAVRRAESYPFSSLLPNRSVERRLTTWLLGVLTTSGSQDWNN